MERNKPSATAKVPQEWVEQLEKIAKQTGKSVNELVRDAIAQYLGVGEQPSEFTPLVNRPPNPPNLGGEQVVNLPKARDFEQLSAELATYKTQLTQLNQKVNDLLSYSQLVTTLQIRLTSLEGKIIQNHQDKAIATTSSELINTDEDTYDDEPDEILPDFLPRS
jgi:hypothetical protein